MCWDQSPNTCQKQHLSKTAQTESEPAGQVDVPTWLEVCVMGDPRHLQGPQKSHRLSKTTQTVWTSWLGRHCYWSRGLCDGGSRTWLGTTDVSPPVKNNTDRMNQLFRLMFLLGWRSVWWGSWTHVGTTDVSPPVKNTQHRQNEPAGQETFQLGWRSVQWGIPDMYRDHRHLIGCQKQYRQNELAGWVEVPTGVDVRVTADPRHM